eukprot:g27567.t2
MELSISLCVTGSVLERYEQELTILVRVGDDVVERCMDVKLCVRAQMEPSVMRSAFPLTERRKIDEKGAYLHFPGITVVCDLALESRASLSHLPDLLKASPLLGPYLAPLPVTSYHVTLLDICCQYKLGLDDEAWCSFCAHPRWAAAAKLLRGISGERGEESPEAPFVLRLAVERLEISHGCVGGNCLVLRACGETPEHPSAVAVGRRLEGLLEAQPQKWPWHLTLAYGLNGLRRTAESEPTAVEAERHALEEQIRRALPDELRFAQALLARACRAGHRRRSAQKGVRGARVQRLTATIAAGGAVECPHRCPPALSGEDGGMGTVSNFDLGKRAEAPLEKLLELGKKPLLGGEGTSSSPRVGPVIPPKELMSVMQWVLIQSRDMPPGTLQWWANPMREPSSRSARSARSARGNACLSCWVWQRRFDTRTHTL